MEKDANRENMTQKEKRIDTLKKKSSYTESEWEDPYRFQKKYMEKKGLIVKSYKMPKNIVDKFRDICKEQGKSQNSVLTKLMISYIEEIENNNK